MLRGKSQFPGRPERERPEEAQGLPRVGRVVVARNSGIKAASATTMVLRSFQGLGDVLATVGVGYAAAESGQEVKLALEGTDDVPQMVPLDLAQLNPLPLVGTVSPKEVYATPVDLRHITWTAGDVHAAACHRIGLRTVSTPRYGLQIGTSGEAALRLRRLKLGGRYLVLCPNGNWAGPEKALSEAQLRAVAETAEKLGLEVVTVGSSKGEWAPGRDVRGETPLDELCVLVSEATIVVSAETGVAHLAICYNVPCIVVTPARTKPNIVDYAPVGYLIGERCAADVPTEAISRAVRRMVAAAEAPWQIIGTGRTDCGVAEVARIVAEAAGVPCVTQAQRNWEQWAVAEYLDAYGEPPKHLRTVLSAHTDGVPNVDQYPAVIWHKAAYHQEWGRICRRAHYVPLPVREGPTPPRPGGERRNDSGEGGAPRHLMWHGHVHRRKGLPALVEAFGRVRAQIPEARLTILAGVGYHDRQEHAWLEGVKAAGVTVEQRDYWEPEELRRRLGEADLFVHPEPDDGEQSAASTTVLPFGRPVIVSRSTRHDEVRGWCETAGGDLAATIVTVMTDPAKYERLCRRALMGASYRGARLIARQYKAAIVQAIYDERMEGEA